MIQRVAAPAPPVLPSLPSPPPRSRDLLDELGVLAGAVRDVGTAELGKLRLRVERTGIAVARATAFVLTGLVVLGASLVLAVVGLVGGLSSLTGWPWWASALGLGLGAPALTALAVTRALSRYDRRRAAAVAARPTAEVGR